MQRETKAAMRHNIRWDIDSQYNTFPHVSDTEKNSDNRPTRRAADRKTRFNLSRAAEPQGGSQQAENSIGQIRSVTNTRTMTTIASWVRERGPTRC